MPLRLVLLEMISLFRDWIVHNSAGIVPDIDVFWIRRKVRDSMRAIDEGKLEVSSVFETSNTRSNESFPMDDGKDE